TAMPQDADRSLLSAMLMIVPFWSPAGWRRVSHPYATSAKYCTRTGDGEDQILSSAGAAADNAAVWAA
ncbi:MAG TPA: hypothetical protein VIH62_02920, partial [Xanthobacteraceae bacterium]